mgnify:CR=1 FL=1
MKHAFDSSANELKILIGFEASIEIIMLDESCSVVLNDVKFSARDNSGLLYWFIDEQQLFSWFSPKIIMKALTTNKPSKCSVN